MVHRVAWNLQRTAECCEKDSKCEHAGEQPLLVDAQCRHHVAILSRRPDQHTPTRALKDEPQGCEHERTEAYQKQVVGRGILTEKVDRAFKSGCTPAQKITRSPDQHDQIFDHQRQAEGRQQLKQFRDMIYPAQQHHFDQHADRCNDERRRQNTRPESKRVRKSFGQREGDISAQHVERAMGEIDDPGHAENDRQSRGHEKQRGRARKTGQELNDVKGHFRIRSKRLRAHLAPAPVSLTPADAAS